MIKRLALSLLCIAFASQPLAARNETVCKTGYVEWEDRSLDDIVQNSNAIFLAYATEFVPDTSREGFEGYYIMLSSGTEFKGRGQGQVHVYGKTPYQTPPQVYFEIENRHRELAARYRNYDQVQIPGGVAEATNVETHCPLAPKFVIGYSYLVMLGTDSRLSFEPIHAARNDAWFLLIRELVEAN